MSERVSRSIWLNEEVAALQAKLDRLPTGDPEAVDDQSVFASMERVRVEEAIAAFRTALVRLEIGAMHLRLTGEAVQGSAVDAETLEHLIGGLRGLGDAMGAQLLVDVPVPGSHVVEIVPPETRQLWDDPFAEVAGLVVDSFRAGRESNVDEATIEFAADREPKVVQALTRLVRGIVDHRINVNLTAELHGETRTVELRREHANRLHRALVDVAQEVEEFEVVGRFAGGLEGRGTFELDVSGEPFTGRIPIEVRPQLVGLAIGQTVRAVLERITTQRTAGGGTRIRYRLRSIEAAAG